MSIEKNKRKKQRRDQIKHPNLKKQYNPRLRQEYIDYEYLDQLSQKELDWLDKFSGEYYGAAFNEDDSKNIQSKDKYKKDCEDRNNARNRDTYGIVKNRTNPNLSKALLNYEDMLTDDKSGYFKQHKNAALEFPEGHDPRNLENSYIDFIESQEIKAMMKEYRDFMRTFTEVSEYPEPWQPVLQSPSEPSETLKPSESEGLSS